MLVYTIKLLTSFKKNYVQHLVFITKHSLSDNWQQLKTSFVERRTREIMLCIILVILVKLKVTDHIIFL